LKVHVEATAVWNPGGCRLASLLSFNRDERGHLPPGERTLISAPSALLSALCGKPYRATLVIRILD